MEVSGATQNAEVDMAPSGPVFSYAQAAKGRSTSVSHLLSKSETLDVGVKSLPQHPKDWAEESENPSDEHESEPSTLKNTGSTPPLPQPSPEVKQQTATSTIPSSPDLSTVSTSTLPKEDDLFITTNGSSDSTWDKQSQTSQSAEKIMNRDETDKEDAKSPIWDHPSSTTLLKEASLPIVNIWQQRALEKQAKAGKEPKAMNWSSANFNEKNAGLATNNRKVLENGSVKVEAAGNGKQVLQGGEEMISTGTVLGKSPREEVPSSTRRGNRSPEVVKGTSVAPLPPPGDAISWPTPDSAQGEEKRRAHDKGERLEKNEKEKVSATRSHGKEKWVPVPYVPNAVFTTPLPPGRRGGRPSRGGREGNGRGGHAPHGSLGGEKQIMGTINNVVGPATLGGERGRMDMGPSRGGALSIRPKRSVSAGPPAFREPRKSSEAGMQERRNDSASFEQKFAYNSRPTPGDGRRTSIATQTDHANGGRQLSPSVSKGSMQPPRRPTQNTMDQEDRLSKGQHDSTASRPNAAERKSEGSTRPADFRDVNGFSHPRERGEGRPDRGRGGYRGSRGGMNGYNGNHLVNGHSFSNGHATHPSASGFVASKSHSANERHSQQGAQFNTPQRESRAYRTNSRSQSIPNPPPAYGRYLNGGSSGNQQLPALQTQIANMYGYESGQSGVMSAFAFHPHMEQMQLLGMVQMQMEYYFSVDNLCKDMFLRKHMDSQGYVFLSILTNFNRIKQLTSDMDLIRYVCLHSHPIEFQTGTDGIDRVRKADGWQQWILGIEERDDAAKNEDPVQMQQLRYVPPQTLELTPGSLSRGDVPWRASLNHTSNHVEDTAVPQPDGSASAYAYEAPRKLSNDQISDAPITQTPLSAAVPDFAPGVPLLSNKRLSTVESHATKENYFSDEQVESLMIVVRKPILATTSLRAPMSLAASRTFSNGSIDSRSLSAESATQGDASAAANINGDHVLESAQIRESGASNSSRSPSTAGSSGRPTHSLPIFWVKHEENPIGDLPPDLTHESYTVFRHNALKERDQSQMGQCPRDMDILYQFWSHFLIRNFNPAMYEEFRHLSFEDITRRETSVGIKNLVQYYDESILGPRVVSDDLARDYVDLVKTELSRNEKLAFDKLRATWRNGAFNMRNRSKIDKIIDSELKAQLEL